MAVMNMQMVIQCIGIICVLSRCSRKARMVVVNALAVSASLVSVNCLSVMKDMMNHVISVNSPNRFPVLLFTHCIMLLNPDSFIGGWPFTK